MKKLSLLFFLCCSLALSYAQDRSNLRIIILIPEEVIRKPVPDPAAETEIMRALIEAGYRLVDMNQSERLEQREALKLDTSDESYQALKSRFNADVLITGEAFSEEDTVLSGVSFFQARLEVKAIDLSTGQIFFSEAYTAPGKNVTPSVAAKDALQNAGVQAGQVLPEKLDLWQAGIGTTGRVYVLRIENAASFSAFNSLLEQLAALPMVTDVNSRQFDQESSEVEVSFQGEQSDLAVLLETNLGLSITGISAGEIRASF